MHNMHTDTHPPIHTQHTSHCSERDFSTLALKDTLPHPTLFQIGKYPELIMVFYTFHLFLHVQVKCTVVKTTCNVSTAES